MTLRQVEPAGRRAHAIAVLEDAEGTELRRGAGVVHPERAPAAWELEGARRVAVPVQNQIGSVDDPFEQTLTER